MGTALALAKRIAANGQLAVRLSKQLLDRVMDVDLRAGLAGEADGFGLCFSTADQTEGMTAFLEKRKAAFRGA